MENTTYLRACSNDGATFGITLEKAPFAQGASRFAFYGTLHNFRQHDEKKVVVKIFKEEYAKHLDPWTPDLTASDTAQKFSEEFNVAAKEAGISHAPLITFLMPRILKVVEVTRYNFPYNFLEGNNNEYFHRGDFILVEIFVEGTYVKFNSNGGYEDSSLPGSESLLAFSHWTWSKSNGETMVCDLQGVIQGDSYVLTDPAIHTKDCQLVLGSTNLGNCGMRMVLSNHKCTDFCKKLGLKNPFMSFQSKGNKSTTYSFQLPKPAKHPADLPCKKDQKHESARPRNIVAPAEPNVCAKRDCFSAVSPTSQTARYIIGNYRPTRIY